MRALVFSLGFLAAIAVAPSARAQTEEPSPPFRFGLLPLMGFGVAGVTNSGDLPSFIGFTSLGVEVHGERPPWGLLLRGQFLASGADGRWTAPSLSLGGSYRLFGDGVEHLSLLGRGGLLYERWHATNVATGCPVRLFFPTNCKAFPPIVPTGNILYQPVYESVTVETAGIFGGARLELPLKSFFVAIDAELTMVADLSASSPGAVFGVRSGLAFGLKDRRGIEDKTQTPRGPRIPRRGL